MEGSRKIILIGIAANEQWFIAVVYIPYVTNVKCLNVLDEPGCHWDLSYFLLACNHTLRIEGTYFISPLKVFRGPQENTADCSFLYVVGNITIFMGFNIGPEY